MQLVIFMVLFWTTVLGTAFSVVLCSPFLFILGVVSFFGIIVFLYSLNPTKADKDIAKKTKAQQKYDNEYGVISYIDTDKKNKTR